MGRCDYIKISRPWRILHAVLVQSTTLRMACNVFTTTLVPFENAEIEIKDQIIADSKKPDLHTTHFFTICRRMHVIYRKTVLNNNLTAQGHNTE